MRFFVSHTSLPTSMKIIFSFHMGLFTLLLGSFLSLGLAQPQRAPSDQVEPDNVVNLSALDEWCTEAVSAESAEGMCSNPSPAKTLFPQRISVKVTLQRQEKVWLPHVPRPKNCQGEFLTLMKFKVEDSLESGYPAPFLYLVQTVPCEGFSPFQMGPSYTLSASRNDFPVFRVPSAAEAEWNKQGRYYIPTYVYHFMGELKTE